MPKAARKSTSEREEAGPSGVVNSQQAEDHKRKMEKMIEDLEESVKDEAVTKIMEVFIDMVKTICREVHAPMKSADTKKVLHLMGDPYGLALKPNTKEIEERLEVVMPEELTEMEDLLQIVSSVEPISEEAKEKLITMMDHTAEAYHHAAHAAEHFTEQAQTCSTKQLMLPQTKVNRKKEGPSRR